MSLGAELKSVAELAQRFANNAAPGLAELFFAQIAALPRNQAAAIIDELAKIEVDDDIRTFVERSFLSNLAAYEDIKPEEVRLIFDCEDWEALTKLAKHPNLDSFTQRRAQFEADQIKKAYLSQF